VKKYVDDERRCAATAIGLAGLDTVAPLIGGPEAHGAVGFALVGTLGLVVVWHFGQVVQAQARHRLRLRFELAITLIYAGVNVGAVALLGVGVEGAFYGGLVTFLLVAPPYWYVTRDWHGWTVSAAALRRLLAAGLPLVPANVGAALVVGAGAFFLKAEAAYVAVGLLGVALMLANVLQVASYAFAQVWLPFAHGRTGEAGARQELARVHGAYAAALFVVWAAISLFAQEAIAVIVPPAYAEAHRYVAPLTAALAIGETGLAAAVGLGLAGRLRPRAWVALVAALFHLAGLTLAVPAFGLAGVAGMALATAILSAALLARVADRVYPVPYRWPPILLLWAVGALLVAPLQWLDLSIGHFLLKLAALAAAAGLPFGLRLVSFAVIRGLVRQ